MYFVYFVVALVLSLLSSCSQPTDSPDDGVVVRERISVSGPISEDTVWESGKEYYVTGDVTVEAGATLTIQPDVVVKFAHERADDYYGITVEGTLMADGGDSTTTILFTSGAAEWARKPGDWRGIEVEASSDSSSLIRYCGIEYANVGIKADGSSPDVSYCVVEQCADTGILFYGSEWGEVAWCMVRENKNGIRFELVKRGVIARCVVEENEENGIECKTSSPDIANNRIEKNGVGIYCSHNASPFIVHNEIRECTKGIVQYTYCFSLIRLNVFVGSYDVAIDIAHSGGAEQPVVEYNNFSQNHWLIFLFVRFYTKDIFALHNWWGTTQETEIAEKIRDRYDQETNEEIPLGRVFFVPYEAASVDSAGIEQGAVLQSALRR